MAYIGKAPNTAIVNQTTSQSFNGTGSATAFTLNRSVNVSEDLEVFVNNVQQEPGSGKAYTASGTTLTFSAAPASGTGNIYVIYRGEATINPRLEHDANSALAATTGTFTGAFTSPGIDDNADATAITIDSSENVLVGKTSASVTTVGAELRPDGAIIGVRDADLVALLNRTSSDGEIISLRKDNSVVGSIGAASGDLTIHGDVGIRFSGDDVRPLNSSGAQADNSVDLGHHDVRWQDLYLGGNLYLGGTGSANAISDVEEGTFTPTAEGNTTAGTGTYLYQVGSYVKVGSLVQFQLNMQWSSHSGSGAVLVKGLPFTSKNTTNLFSVGSMYASGLPISSNHRAMPFMLPNRTYFNVNQENGSGGASSVNIDSAAQILLTGVYRTDA